MNSQTIQFKEKWKYFKWSHYKNNFEIFSFIIIYVISIISLSIHQLWSYWDVNIPLKIARVCGILISFNFAFSLVLVLRKTSSLLRNRKFSQTFLPLDNFLSFHKFVGVFIFVLCIVHTISHCVNLYLISEDYNMSGDIVNRTNVTVYHSYASLLFTTSSNFGWFFKAAVPTGWVLLLLLVIMEIFSTRFIRRRGHFNLFYYTHLLYIPIYAINIIHSKNFWMWIIGPVILFLIERISSLLRIKSLDHGSTSIKDVNLLPSRVTQLVITRPSNFKFKSGDYVYINIPLIAKNEWHPFTISSAPELQGEIWLHIRSLGDWTNKLHDHFLEYSSFNRYRAIFEKKKSFYNLFKSKIGGCCGLPFKDENDQSNIVTISYSQNELNRNVSINLNDQESDVNENEKRKQFKFHNPVSNHIKGVLCDINIDGPYGTASRQILNAEHAVLIAAGIGVTPFASILQSLWFKYSTSIKKCSQCSHEWYELPKLKNLKKVDFIWINRDHKAFEWFIELLAHLELQQSELNNEERFIEFRFYVTSAKSKDEIKSNTIEAYTISINNPNLKSILEDKLKDIVEKMEPGRPNLENIFNEINKNKKGKVQVFFCGANDLGDQISSKCEAFDFKFSKETF